MQTGEMVTAEPGAPAKPLGLNPLVVARDIATLGGGTLLAAAFNFLLIFLIPRLVSVENYGYWRLFALYAGYAGFLHLGLADGVLLKWAGKPLEEFECEFRPSLKFLVWQHIAVIVPIGLAIAIFLRPGLRFVVIAALAFALVMNPVTLLRFGLQSARSFSPVAVSTVSAPGIFLALVALWALRAAPDFQILIVLYFAAWVATLAYLLARLRHRFSSHSSSSAWALGWGFIGIGWPVLLTNTNLVLVRTADRLVVSWDGGIRDFALYSLAGSVTVTVAFALLGSAFNVLFPHLAALEAEQHKRTYGMASRLLLLFWVLLLPYYFVVELLIRHFLPQYVGSLGIAAVLLLGTVFLGVIQVLHMSFAYVHGRQREFLWYTLVAVVVSFAFTGGLAIATHSLRAVAAGEVAALAVWWAVNERKLREVTGQTLRGSAHFLALYGWAAGSFWICLHEAQTVAVRVGLYYALVAGTLWVGCLPEVRFCLRAFSRVRGRSA